MYSPSHYRKNDPHFVRDLKASVKHTEKVAEWLRSRGFKDIVVLPIRIRSSIAKMSECSDDGDMVVDGMRAEAKHRKQINFTCAEDFPYDTIIVDVVHAFDKADPKPEFYVLTNKSLTHCCVVHCWTSQSWKKTTRWDRGKKRNRAFYECPIRLAEFFKFSVRKTGSSASPSRPS